jgi:type II secretory pathway predicted ATPase ExeA
LVERPFSLTPDARYFFAGRSHGRALDALTSGLERRERILLLMGDLGVGKTTVCRMLSDEIRRCRPVAVVPNPLMSPPNFLRLVLQDFGAISSHEARALDSAASVSELCEEFVTHLLGLERGETGVVIIIDEAHHLPTSLLEPLRRVASLTEGLGHLVQLVFAMQPPHADGAARAIESLHADVVTRARLLPLGRDDCARYVSHRLTVAGGTDVTFTPRAIDMLFSLSGGVPRLINLICERALHDAAERGSHQIAPASIEAAASSLELLRTRPRRFRWFHKRVS